MIVLSLRIGDAPARKGMMNLGANFIVRLYPKNKYCRRAPRIGCCSFDEIATGLDQGWCKHLKVYDWEIIRAGDLLYEVIPFCCGPPMAPHQPIYDMKVSD